MKIYGIPINGTEEAYKNEPIDGCIDSNCNSDSLAMVATLNTDKPSAPISTAEDNSSTTTNNKVKVVASFYPHYMT
jgi:hypothetical protein